MVAESCFVGNLSDRVVGRGSWSAAQSTRKTAQVGRDRHAVVGTEHAGQVHGVNAGSRRDVIDPQVLREAVVQHVTNQGEPRRWPTGVARTRHPGGSGQHLEHQPGDRERRELVGSARLAANPRRQRGDPGVTQMRATCQHGPEGVKDLPAPRSGESISIRAPAASNRFAWGSPAGSTRTVATPQSVERPLPP